MSAARLHKIRLRHTLNIIQLVFSLVITKKNKRERDKEIMMGEKKMEQEQEEVREII